uniref:Uncharacterized protein n=1 Tax=Aureoumbra lagunensis TaxID=44058 RepID=A0A7S3JUS4_9STRA
MIVLYDSESQKRKRELLSLNKDYIENVTQQRREACAYVATYKSLALALGDGKGRFKKQRQLLNNGCNLRFVDLSGAAIFGLNKQTVLQCCQILARALPEAWALKALSIRSVDLGDEGLITLSSGLKKCGANYISLRDCNLGQDAGEMLASVLRAQNIRRDEYIWKHNLRKHGALFLSSSKSITTQQKCVEDINIGQAGLQVLDLANNPHLGGSTEFSHALSNDKWLLGLNIMNNNKFHLFINEDQVSREISTSSKFVEMENSKEDANDIKPSLISSSALVCLLTNIAIPSNAAHTLETRLEKQAQFIRSNYSVAAAVLTLWAQDPQNGFSLELLRSNILKSTTQEPQHIESCSIIARKIIETSAPSKCGKLYTSADFELALRRARANGGMSNLDILLRAQRCRDHELFFKVNNGKGITTAGLTSLLSNWAIELDDQKSILEKKNASKISDHQLYARFDLAEYLYEILNDNKTKNNLLTAIGLDLAFRRAEQAARTSWISAKAVLIIRELKDRLGEDTPLQAWVKSIGSQQEINSMAIRDAFCDVIKESDSSIAASYIFRYALISSKDTSSKNKHSISATELIHAISLALDNASPTGGGTALAQIIHFASVLQLFHGPHWTLLETARQTLAKIPSRSNKNTIIKKNEIVSSLRLALTACGVVMIKPNKIFDNLKMLRIKMDAVNSFFAYKRTLLDCTFDRTLHMKKKRNSSLLKRNKKYNDQIFHNLPPNGSPLDTITLTEAWTFCRSVCENIKSSNISASKLEDCIQRARRSAFDAKRLRNAAAKVAILRNELLKRRVDLDAWLEAAEKIVFSAKKSDAVNVDELRIGLHGLLKKSVQINDDDIKNNPITNFVKDDMNHEDQVDDCKINESDSELDIRSIIDEAVAALILFSRVDNPDRFELSELRRANARAAAATLPASLYTSTGNGPTDDDLADFLEADENPDQRRIARALNDKVLIPNNWSVHELLSIDFGGGPSHIHLLLTLQRYGVFKLRSRKERALFEKLTKPDSGGNFFQKKKKNNIPSKPLLPRQQQQQQKKRLSKIATHSITSLSSKDTTSIAAKHQLTNTRKNHSSKLSNPSLDYRLNSSLRTHIPEEKKNQKDSEDVDFLEALESAVLNIAHRIDDIERRLADC